MDWLRITERLIVPVAVPTIIVGLVVGLDRSDDAAARQTMAGLVEKVLAQNGRLITELHDRIRKDRAALTATQERLRESEARVAAMKASLAATIKTPTVQTVEVAPVKPRRRRRR